MQPLTEEQLEQIRKDLKLRHIIVPRWAVAVWGSAVILVLAAMGITSYVGFSNAVSSIAASAATSSATTTATTVAATKAADVVDKIFSETIEQSKQVAKQVAQTVISNDVAPVVEQAAKRATEIEIRKQLTDTSGKNIIDEMYRRDSETKNIATQIGNTWNHVRESTFLNEIIPIRNDLERLKQLNQTQHIQAHLHTIDGKDVWTSTGGISAIPLSQPLEFVLSQPSIVLLSVAGSTKHVGGHEDLHFGFLSVSGATPVPLNPFGYWRRIGDEHENARGWRSFSLTQAIPLPAGTHNLSVGPLRVGDGSWMFHYVRVDATVIPLGSGSSSAHSDESTATEPIGIR